MLEVSQAHKGSNDVCQSMLGGKIHPMAAPKQLHIFVTPKGAWAGEEEALRSFLLSSSVKVISKASFYLPEIYKCCNHLPFPLMVVMDLESLQFPIPRLVTAATFSNQSVS